MAFKFRSAQRGRSLPESPFRPLAAVAKPANETPADESTKSAKRDRFS
jgi:hypothetical protein